MLFAFEGVFGGGRFDGDDRGDVGLARGGRPSEKVCAGRRAIGMVPATHSATDVGEELSDKILKEKTGAGEGNRTPIFSLGS